MADILAAVDFVAVAAFVTTAGVAIIGICMGEKGIHIGKRNVKKAQTMAGLLLANFYVVIALIGAMSGFIVAQNLFGRQ